MPIINMIDRAINLVASKISLTSATGGGGSSVNRDPKVIGVKPEGFQLNDGGGGRDNFEEFQVDLEVLDNAIQTDSYMMMAMMRYSELVSKSGYYFSSKNEQVLEYLYLRLMFMEAGTKISFDTLVKEIIDDLVRYSNAFFIIARSKKGEGLPPGAPVQPILPSKAPIAGYFRVHPKTMSIARSETGEILRYKQEVQGGESKEYNPEDVIHFTLNKPSGRAFSIPWAYPALEDIRLLRKIEENIAVLIYKHIFPLMKYKVGMHKEGLEATDEEIEEVTQEIENLPTDGIIVMPERHELDSVKLEPLEAEGYLNYFESRVFTGIGMSHVDMGRGDTANRNTADSMDSQKIDRVKDWQRQIQDQIDSKIIDQLLIEGGYDPLMNPEFDADFVFNEIENEKKMALENHTINKFNNNLISYEEARSEIGEDIVVDESRLHFSMFNGAAGGEDGAVKNNAQPENQHGKRDSPKESEDILLNLKESSGDSARSFRRDFGILLEEGLSSKEAKFESTLMNKSIYNIVEDEFIQPLRNKGIDTSMIVSYSKDWIQKISRFIDKEKSELNKEGITPSEYRLGINILTSTVLSRSLMFSNYIEGKSLNLEYATLRLRKGKQLVVESEKGCEKCKKHDKKTFFEMKMSELEKKALYYQVPPYHIGCKCKITEQEGEF